MPHSIYYAEFSAFALAMNLQNFSQFTFSELSSTEKWNILEKVSLAVGQNISATNYDLIFYNYIQFLGITYLPEGDSHRYFRIFWNKRISTF